MSDGKFGRRDLLKRAAAVGAGMAAVGTGIGSAFAQDAAPEAGADIKPIVPKRKLGKTGEMIPMLLMGGSQKFDPVFDKMLHRAFKLGMTYIDTAESYANGQSHITLAPFIKQVGRENLWITSKSGMFGGSAPATVAMYRDAIMKEFAILGTDHLDAYFFHGLKHTECLEPEYLKFADEMKKSKKAKYFGFSCHDGNVVDLLNKAASIGGDGVNMIMFKYSFRDYGDVALNKAMDACVKAGIGLMAMKTQSSVPQDADMVKKFQSENFTLHQAKLRAALADERITAAVSGINNMQILMENVKSVSTDKPVTAKEMLQLERHAAETASYYCRGCTHVCETKVASDLKIGQQLRYLMYAECYDEADEARRLYAKLAVSERDFHGVDLDDATKACPQKIDIRARLEKARALLA